MKKMDEILCLHDIHSFVRSFILHAKNHSSSKYGPIMLNYGYNFNEYLPTYVGFDFKICVPSSTTKITHNQCFYFLEIGHALRGN